MDRIIKNIFLLPCLSCAVAVSTVSFAQQDTNKPVKHAYITACAGVGISPNSTFNKKSNTNWDNYVLPGFSSLVSGGYPIINTGKVSFGVTAAFGYYLNVFDMNRYLSYLKSGDANNDSYVASSYGDFTQYSLLAGIYSTFHTGRTTFEVRGMFGKDFVVLPNCAFYLIYTTPFNYSLLETETYSSSGGYGFDCGLQVNYTITGGLSATLSSDLLLSSCNYTNTLYKGSNPAGIVGAPGVADLQTLNLTGGLTYSFGKNHK